MDNTPTPVFYTPSRRRWRLFRGSALLLVLLLTTALGIGIWTVYSPDAPGLPTLQSPETAFHALTRPDAVANEQTGGVPRRFHEHKPLTSQHTAKIRAGFYVNWDAQSYQTLRDHVGQMNMVMPEWLFVGNRAELTTDIDAKADSLLKAHTGVAVVPMISNFYEQDWRGKNVHRLINDPARRKAFIGQVIAALQKHHFQGVNVDFEEIDEPTSEPLTRFLTELGTALHGHKFILSVDVAALNPDYDLKALSPVVDQVMLMAYDLHQTSSGPGAVAPYQWVEYVLEQTCKQVPSEKVVLGLAAFGYDWPKGGAGLDITYQQAMARANRKTASPVVYDNKTYSLHFTYTDDAKRLHTVWFHDAASAYNIVRAAEDYETGGTAIWRLGSEDARTWDFYARDLSVPTLQRQPYRWQQLETIAAMPRVDFEGEGEILDMAASPRAGRLRLEYDSADQLISEETYLTLPTSYIVRKTGKADKTVVLSFDDGPDEVYTPQILSILEKEHVPATFFVIGINAERNVPLLRQMANAGYEIGNHTTLHPNLSEASADRMYWELNTCRRIIETITGRSTILFRPPYNADAEPDTPDELAPLVRAQQQHYYTIGESIDPLDWQQGVTADQIMDRIKAQQELGSTILLHDAGGDRSATVAALPRIIRYYKQRGFRFATVGQLLHKPMAEIMPPVDTQTAGFFTDWAISDGLYYGQHMLTWLFLIGAVLALSRIIVVGWLAVRQQKQEKQTLATTPFVGLVSVIVPAYNEQTNAVRTVESLLASDYADLEVVFVDDGSNDATYATVRDWFMGDERVRVLTKPNGGKASALNHGIARARGEVLICIDADTLLLPDAVRLLANALADSTVGAVAGTVSVGNLHNWLTRFQAIEYVTSQNFDRRAYAVLNAITVIPGAIGAFRRSALLAVGGFTTDTLAEDCDLTIRLLRTGYRVVTCNAACAVTEAPETLPMLLKQRVRWSYGIMQTVWKHRDLWFRSYAPCPDLQPADAAGTAPNRVPIAGLGWLAMPGLLLFQFVSPLLTPVAELQLLLSLLTDTWGVVLAYFGAFLLIDALVAVLAFRLAGEPLTRLWGLIPQRLTWRYLMFWVLIRAYGNAIRGEVTSWGFLKRTGRVRLATTTT